MSLTGKPELANAQPLSNDGFWPNLQLGDLLADYRIPSEYADGVIKTGLIMAMIRVNEQLAPVKQALLDLDYDTLAAYSTANTRLIAGVDIMLTQYKHAVFCRAKAGLLQQFKTMNRRPQAENEARESEQTEQYWLDESQGCIKAFFDLLLPESTTLGKANAHVVLL